VAGVKGGTIMGYILTFMVGMWFGYAVCAILAMAKEN